MKYEAREIRAAMTANSLSNDVLTDYINQEIGKDFKPDSIRRIIMGVRNNSEVERVIEDLLGDWIESQREMIQSKITQGAMIPEQVINEAIQRGE
jgi:peptidyl-tRNA hydrolase